MVALFYCIYVFCWGYLLLICSINASTIIIVMIGSRKINQNKFDVMIIFVCTINMYENAKCEKQFFLYSNLWNPEKFILDVCSHFVTYMIDLIWFVKDRTFLLSSTVIFEKRTVLLESYKKDTKRLKDGWRKRGAEPLTQLYYSQRR